MAALRIIRFAEKNWRPDARTLISTGDYRIPEDMPLELAERAVAEGAAVVVEVVPPVPPQPAVPARRKAPPTVSS